MIGFNSETIQDDLNYALKHKDELYNFFNETQKQKLNNYMEWFFRLKETSITENKEDPHLYYIAVMKYSQLFGELKDIFDFMYKSYSYLERELMTSIQGMNPKDPNVKHFLDAIQKIIRILKSYKNEELPDFDDLKIHTINASKLYDYNWQIAQLLRYIVEEVYVE